MIDPERKEAGADFSDRPKSTAGPSWLERCAKKEIARHRRALAYWESILEQSLKPIPARSGADEGGTAQEIGAGSEQ